MKLSGAGGRSLPSTILARTSRPLGIRHLRTRPSRPQTNGKAERFIQTMLREWASGALCKLNVAIEPARRLARSLHNYRRKYGSLRHRRLRLAS